MRTIPSEFYKRLDALLDEGVLCWVEAIELTTGQTFYLTTNSESVIHGGRRWLPFPMQIGDFEDSGEGNLPSTTLSLTNVGRLPMVHLEAGGWDQARVVSKLILVDSPDLEIGVRFDLTVQAAVATHETVTLHLGQPNFFERRFPSRRFLRSELFPGIPRNIQ
ncbi:MAG: hypothetical protein V3U03_17565 [Myxococcota bacterium]